MTPEQLSQADPIMFGVYSVIVFALGIGVGAWLTWRRQEKKPPVSGGVFNKPTVLNMTDQGMQQKSRKDDTAKRWSA